jgi:hypothetical protein
MITSSLLIACVFIVESAVDVSQGDKSKHTDASSENISLDRRHFLLFVFHTSSESATKSNITTVLKCLMHSLENLTPSDCISSAFMSAKNRIQADSSTQVLVWYSTLTKKLCVGKYFNRGRF